MLDDYRNTEFCPQLMDIEDRKKTVVDLIKRDYPKARDMHAYISKNKEPYKTSFYSRLQREMFILWCFNIYNSNGFV